jgi:NAD-dependent deacetylase
MSKLKLVVFTGAGISKESGLHTFRDADGLWNNFKIEEVCTPEALRKDPKKVLDFYNDIRRKVIVAEPNAAHKAIAELEEDYDVTVITQNIDDLHERAGSTNVLHLHGDITKTRSIHESRIFYPYTEDIKVGDLAEDGYQLRPHVVFFGESVPAIAEAKVHTLEADILVIIGTSLEVYPAANVVSYIRQGTPIYAVGPEVPLASDLEANAFGGNKHKRANYTPIQEPATKGVEILIELLQLAKMSEE